MPSFIYLFILVLLVATVVCIVVVNREKFEVVDQFSGSRSTCRYDAKLKLLGDKVEYMFEYYNNKEGGWGDGYLTHLNDELKNVHENVMLCTDKTSYTINKENIYIALAKETYNPSYYDNHTLMHVLLHELAHVICPESGALSHGPLWSGIFEELMDRAQEFGIYDRSKEIDFSYPGA